MISYLAHEKISISALSCVEGGGQLKHLFLSQLMAVSYEIAIYFWLALYLALAIWQTHQSIDGSIS